MLDAIMSMTNAQCDRSINLTQQCEEMIEKLWRSRSGVVEGFATGVAADNKSNRGLERG
jgi:hypothetical protein